MPKRVRVQGDLFHGKVPERALPSRCQMTEHSFAFSGIISRAARCVNTTRPLTTLLDVGERRLSREGYPRSAIPICGGTGILAAAPMILDTEKFEQRGKYWYRKGQRSTHAYELVNCRNPDCGEVCLHSRADHRPGTRGFCSHSCASKALAEQTTGHLRGKTGSAAHGWRGDGIGYSGAHDRVDAARGVASTHPCVDCGEVAHAWCYDHKDPDERISDEGLPYSLTAGHYEPRCVTCHNRFDTAFKLAGAPACAVCGGPTRAIAGVCQRTTACTRELNRRRRAAKVRKEMADG